MSEKANVVNNETSLEEAGNGATIYLVESFMKENYDFRRNLLSGKTEFSIIHADDANSFEEWRVFTKEDLNSIVRRAKKLGIGDKSSPRQDIEEYIESDAISDFDPIKNYLDNLPVWMVEIMWQNCSVVFLALRVNS